MLSNGWVYVKILKDVYGLKWVGKITHDELVKYLARYGNISTKNIPGYWKHDSKLISFV